MKLLHASVGLSLLVGNLPSTLGFFQNSVVRGTSTAIDNHSVQTKLQQTKGDGIVTDLGEVSPFTRRGFVGATAGMAMLTALSPVAGASVIPTVADGNLGDLPNDAVRSYLQYRIPLQIAADYYVFALQDMVGDVDQWGEVGQLFRVNSNRGQGQPSKIGRYRESERTEQRTNQPFACVGASLNV